MTQLFGWINSPTSLSDYRLQAHSHDRVSEQWHNIPVDSITATSVFSIAGCQPGACLHSGSIHAATTGRISWRDPELASIGREQGSALALIKAYQKYGPELVRQHIGHFSYALTDSSKNTAILAIDRLGTQAMCYAPIPNKGLVFGSTTTGVINHPAIDASLNQQALFDYLYFHVIPAPNTIYTAVKKLEPAQFLVYENGKITLDYYWNPVFIDSPAGTSFADLKNGLIEHLHNAVRKTNPDERTGAFLSGGLDSSTVSGMLARVNGDQTDTKTYSIGFNQQGYDEIEYAHIAASHFHTRQTDYYVTPDDISDSIVDIASAYDEPFGNSSAIPALFCARLAKQNGTDVLLAGDGGDELFAGNERYAKQKIFEIYSKIPAFYRKNVLEPVFLKPDILSRLPLLQKIQSYIQQARIPMPARMQSYNFLKRIELDYILEPDFIDSIDINLPDEQMADTYNRAKSKNIVNRMLYLDWKITLADNDLRKVNQMCEFASVEVRYPMLDDELVEFSTRIPPSLKLRGNRLRYFYKNAMQGFLPEQIINKPKHGFGLPFGEWLKNSEKLQELIYTSISELAQRKLVRKQFLDELIATHKTGHAYYYGTMVWVLSMLELWLAKHRS